MVSVVIEYDLLTDQLLLYYVFLLMEALSRIGEIYCVHGGETTNYLALFLIGDSA